MSKTWDDEERHFLQKVVIEYGGGRKILHDLMIRKYGDKYKQQNRGPYKPEYTQRNASGKPSALNKYIYQYPNSDPYSPKHVEMRAALDADIRHLAVQTSQTMRQIVLGGHGVAAYYAAGSPPAGPLAENTTLLTEAFANNPLPLVATAMPSSSGKAEDLTSEANTELGEDEDVVLPQLSMIHRDGLRYGSAENFPRARTNPIGRDLVDETSPIYAYGGQAVRFHTMTGLEDAMLCDLAVCDECEGGQGGSPDSSYKPFVHLGRDAYKCEDSAFYFIGPPNKDLMGSDSMLEKTKQENIVFVVNEKQHLVECEVCVQMECPVCA